jgi:hypothetical protein
LAPVEGPELEPGLLLVLGGELLVAASATPPDSMATSAPPRTNFHLRDIWSSPPAFSVAGQCEGDVAGT